MLHLKLTAVRVRLRGWSLLCLLLCLGTQLFAQSAGSTGGTNPSPNPGTTLPTDLSPRTRLLELARQWRIEDSINRARAYQLAEEKGWPTEFRDVAGRLIVLEGVDAMGMPVYVSEDNAQAARTIRTNRLHPNGGLNLNLTGEGMRISEWDSGPVRLTHRELNGRVRQRDGNSTNYADHATHVAGTLIGAGRRAEARGMAYEAELDAYTIENDEPEMAEAAANDEVIISNHSYGQPQGFRQLFFGLWRWFGDPSVDVEEDYNYGYYNDQARRWDQITHLAPYYVIVRSSGNDRNNFPPDGGTGGYQLIDPDTREIVVSRREMTYDPYDMLPGSKSSKNVLTIGAVLPLANYNGPGSVEISDFSSWGPTDDGRIKPDLVGNGVDVLSSTARNNNAYDEYDGTSMSTPSVAGSLLLIQQHYGNTHEGRLMRAATVRGLAIHTADEAGPAPGPDYSYGWGLANMGRAAETINSETTTARILERTLNEGETWTTEVRAEGADTPLRATLSWNDPPGMVFPPATDNRTPVLINDLDIRIRDVANNTYLPWRLDPENPEAPATLGDNIVDNIEQILIDAPEAGTYVIEIRHKGNLQGGTQEYSLIITGLENVEDCPEPPVAGTITGPTEGQTWQTYTFEAESAAGEHLSWMIDRETFGWQDLSPAVYDNTCAKVFESPGTYRLRLRADAAGCASVYTPPHTIRIDEPRAIRRAEIASGNWPFCPGGSLQVGYETSGRFNAGQTFEVQLSDALGRFVNPAVIGRSSSGSAGTIACTLPEDLTPSADYFFRVVASGSPIQSRPVWLGEVTTCCQGQQTLAGLQGTFDDGSGDRRYGHGYDCRWVIDAASAQAVRLSFNQFRTNFEQDIVSVYAGADINAPLVGTFSGTRMPQPMIISNNQVTVRFVTDNTETNWGWEAEWEGLERILDLNPVNPPVVCPGDTVAVTGQAVGLFRTGNRFLLELSDGEGSFDNPRPAGTVIGTEFRSLDVALPQSLPPGFNYQFRLISTLPADTSPPQRLPFIVQDCEDQGGNNDPCNRNTQPLVLTAPSGTILDGSGPNNYDNNRDCLWLIQPPGATEIEITMEDIRTESGFDYVDVFDGDSPNANRLVRYTGTQRGRVRTTGGAAFVRFFTDGSITSAGWRLSYNSDADPLPEVAIKVPTQFDQRLCTETDLEIPFEATGDFESGNVFTLQISDASGSFDAPQPLANLQSTESGTFRFRIPAGPYPPGDYRLRVVSSRPSFTGDPTAHAFTLESCTTTCSGAVRITDEAGVVNDGSGSFAPYGNNQSCSWLIEPACARSITLSFLEFDTESDADVVSIYAGRSSDGLLIGQYSGSTLPPAFAVTHAAVFITFETSERNTAGGWSLAYASEIAPDIAVTEVSETQLCSGQTMEVAFNSLCLFEADNAFRIELSDAGGNFGNPTELATLQEDELPLSAEVTLPLGLEAGNRYRLRVVSTQPARTGSVYPVDLRIEPGTQPTNLRITTNSPVCQGDTLWIEATAEQAETYRWTGPNNFESTTPRVVWPMAEVGLTGRYTVEANVSGACAIPLTAETEVTVGIFGAQPQITRVQDSLTTEAYERYQWYFEGEPLPNGTTRSIALEEDGYYFVEVTDANGCTARSEESFYQVVSRERPAAFAGLEVYPNPTTGQLRIALPGAHPQPLSLTLRNALGQVLAVETLPAHTQAHTLELEPYPAGVYTLTFESGSARFSLKVVRR